MDFSENSSSILQKALAGDRQAWDDLFTNLWPVVVGVVANRVKAFGGDSLVEDIAQNVFVRLLENDARRLSLFNPDGGALEAYVAKVAFNCSIDYLRSNGKHLAAIDISSLPELISETDTSLPMLEAWEMSAALNSLTPREREVIVLLFKQNISVAAAASRMRVTPDTVRSEKSHALKKLKFFFGQK